MNRLRRNLVYYRSQHRTFGCKLTHMVGIPALILSLILFLSARRREATALFGFGVILQLIGHFVFEHNRPIFMTKQRDPVTLLSALVYVSQSWARLIKGEPLVAIESNGKGHKSQGSV